MQRWDFQMSRIKIVLFCPLILLAPYAFSCSCDMLNPSPEDTFLIDFPNFERSVDLIFFLIFFAIWHISLSILRDRIPRKVNALLSWLGPITILPTAYLSHRVHHIFISMCPCSIKYIYLAPNYLYLSLSVLFILCLDRFIYARYIQRADKPTSASVDL